MKQFKTIILAITAVMAAACTKDIDYKGPDSERMLVVNCVTEAGSVPVFKISHSAFFLDPYYRGNELKKNVTVSVDINGETRNAVYVDSLRGYSDGRALTYGDIISVTASHPEYGTATASDTVPQAQECIYTDYRKEYVPASTMSEMFDDYISDFDDTEVDSVWVAEIEIPGIADKTDYYIMTIEPTMTYYRYMEYDDDYDTIVQYLHYKIPADTKILLGQSDAATAVLEDTEADSQFEYGKSSYIFDDLNIKDGNKFSFNIMMEQPDTLEWPFYDFNLNEEKEYEPYSIAHLLKDDVVYTINVKLYVLSNTYYYYHKSVEDFKQADISFLSEPVTILHNVQGGVGILATYASKTFQSQITRKFK